MPLLRDPRARISKHATLTLLDATLTRGLFVNPVESTLTKKRVGGERFFRGRPGRRERCQRVPIPSGRGVLCIINLLCLLYFAWTQVMSHQTPVGLMVD